MTKNNPWRLFVESTLNHFNFLVEDYGFRHVSTQAVAYECALIFENETTRVTLRRLLGAEGTPMDVCGLGHLLTVRAPDLPRSVTPEVFEPEAIERALHIQETLLRRYASDVLVGNFEIFTEVAKVRDAELERRETEYSRRS